MLNLKFFQEQLLQFGMFLLLFLVDLQELLQVQEKIKVMQFLELPLQLGFVA